MHGLLRSEVGRTEGQAVPFFFIRISREGIRGAGLYRRCFRARRGDVLGCRGASRRHPEGRTRGQAVTRQVLILTA